MTDKPNHFWAERHSIFSTFVHYTYHCDSFRGLSLQVKRRVPSLHEKIGVITCLLITQSSQGDPAGRIAIPLYI